MPKVLESGEGIRIGKVNAGECAWTVVQRTFADGDKAPNGWSSLGDFYRADGRM